MWSTYGLKVSDFNFSAPLMQRRRWLQLASLAVSDRAIGRAVLGQEGTDSEFFRRLQCLSDLPTGPAGADNLMTNEDSIAAVVDQLRAQVPPGQVFLGVGPDQNYSLIAAVRPESAYILDYRKKNQLLHLYHKSILESAETRWGYLERFWARRIPEELNSQAAWSDLIEQIQRQPLEQERLAENRAKLRHCISAWNFLNGQDVDEILKIQSRLAGPGPDARFLALKMYPTLASLMLAKSRSGKPAHWLATDESYLTVRNLSRSNRIFTLVGDWAGTGSVSKLAAMLTADKVKVGAVYISDVEFFLMRGRLFSKYVENLARLPLHPGAVVIRTSTREIKHPERIPGQSSTTIVRPLLPFLELARNGKISQWDDLFHA